MDLHKNNDLIDLSIATPSLLEMNLKKTDELNAIFTALDNVSPILHENIKEDAEVEKDYNEIFVNGNKKTDTVSPIIPTTIEEERPIKIKTKREKNIENITDEMLDEIFMKKMAKGENMNEYEWMNSKTKFKKNDDLSKACKNIDENILMESCIYFNINTENYIIDLDKLISKFERLNGRVDANLKYFIFYKEPYSYPNKRIDSWISLSFASGRFTKTIVDATYNLDIGQCKKYLTDHDKFKKSELCGFKRIFELINTGKILELFCIIKK